MSTVELPDARQRGRLHSLRSQWWSNPRVELLSGLVVALALIPEAISFSIIAGVDPKVGLYASFSIAIIISIAGGRSGMISAATGAMALVVVPLVEEHGVAYLFAATILAGVSRSGSATSGVGALMRFIPRTVMVGFVNALAILIFLAQVPHILLSDEADRSSSRSTCSSSSLGLAIIYGLPRLTTAVPSPLVAIVVLAGAAIASRSRPADGRRHGRAARRAARRWRSPTCRSRSRRCDHPPVRDHAGAGGPARVAAHGTAARRPDRHRVRQERRVARPGHRQRRDRLPRRHGRLRHDRPVDDQPPLRRPDPAVDAGVGRVPARPDPRPRRPRRPDPDGGAGRGDDHGVGRHVQLAQHPARAPARPATETR